MEPQEGLVKEGTESLDKQKKTYKLYKWRWLVLTAYCILTLASTPTSTAYPAISNILQKYYGVKAIAIHVLFVIYGVAILVISLPTSYMLHRFDLGPILKLAATFNLIGGIIRLFGYHENNGYYFILTGNIFSAISLSQFMFLPAKLAQNWFGEHERGQATGICIGFDMVATALGFMHSTHVVHNSDKKDNIRSDLKAFLIQELIMAGIATLAVVFFTQSRPKTPPSLGEEERLNQKNEKNKDEADILLNDINSDDPTIDTTDVIISKPRGASRRQLESKLWNCIKRLLKHKDFLLIIHMGSIGLASEITYEMILNDVLIKYFPGKEKEIGIIGFSAIIFGFFTNIIMGFIIDLFQIYKRITIYIFLSVSVCLGVWTILLEIYPSFFLIAFSFCLYSAINTSYYAVSYTHVVIATYPVTPDASSMLLFTITAFYSSLFAFGGSYVLEHLKILVVNIIILTLTVGGLVLSMFLENDGERKL